MNSKEYWRKREEENLANNLKTEAVYIKELHSYYDNMLDQIEKEINGFYGKYARKEGIPLAEAKRRVSKLDIEAYERKAEKYVKEKNFSKEANEEMRLYNATMKINRLEMLKANIGLELVDGFDGLQKFFDEKLTERTLSEFERMSGILGKTVLNNAESAKAIVNASFNNARYSDRIWMYQDMMKAELASLLKTGLIQGKNPRELSRHLTKLFGVRKSDAERLMRTELARVQIEAQKQSFERNGYDQYEFIALGSACGICAVLDGKHFDVKKMMPGENAPPMHPNCRCSVAAHMDDEEYEKWLEKQSKSIAKSGGNDTIRSGAISGALNPNSKEADEHANRYYESVRHMTNDTVRIAKNTGWKQSAIEQIKNYVFVEEHDLIEGHKRFTPSYDMAQSWQRLIDGKIIKEQDWVLLKHEYLEMKLVEKGMTQDEAHIAASKKHNFAKYLE